MPGVGAPAFLAPANFVRSPEMAGKVWSAEEGRAYTRWLATNHYENFHVVSFLLPKRLHQDFYNVYAYCRWADDLADEIGDAAESLRLLEWWRGELARMYAGRATHPVFAALAPTVERYGIPEQPFSDLTLHFNGGPRAPLANPQACGQASTSALLDLSFVVTSAMIEPRPREAMNCRAGFRLAVMARVC